MSEKPAKENKAAPSPSEALATKPQAAEGTKPKKEPKLLEKEDKNEFFKTAVFAIILALIIRSFLFEPFNIPSGSMKPTLQIGDYLFVSKFSYGYSRYSFPLSFLIPFQGRLWNTPPERGDVVVFKLPSDPSVDYIKRIIGLPGERIRVKGGILHINGTPVPREFVRMAEVTNDYGEKHRMFEYIETLPGGAKHHIYEETDNGDLDNTREYIIPPNHYFMMGDNRDHSQDSRVTLMVGPVPFDNIVGRASFLFFSIDDTANLQKPWTWFGAIRYSRLFNGIGPQRPDDPS